MRLLVLFALLLLLPAAYAAWGPAGRAPAVASGSEARPATIIVECPTNAVVTFNGQPTTTTGTRRVFASPLLAPGRDYTYAVTVDGAEHALSVRAGETSTLNAAAPIATIQNFGLDREYVERQQNGHGNAAEILWRKGERVKDFHGPDASGPPDDADKLWLVVCGTDAERKRVLEDWAKSPELAPYRAEFREPKAYADPNHWHLKGVAFDAKGSPCVVIQAPDGQELHRQRDYDGPVSLAYALGQLRKPRPDNRPDLTPDLRKPPALDAPLVAVAQHSGKLLLLALAGAGGLILYTSRKEQS